MLVIRVNVPLQILTLWEPAYDIFVLWFWPKKQQMSVAFPTPSFYTDCAW